MWVYIHSEHSADHDLYTVGFYDPAGKWHTDSDWNTKKEAVDRVHYLNGQTIIPQRPPEVDDYIKYPLSGGL